VKAENRPGLNVSDRGMDTKKVHKLLSPSAQWHKGLKRITEYENICCVLHEKNELRHPFASTRLPDITCRYRKIRPGKTIQA
jgi:hypothetical protein